MTKLIGFTGSHGTGKSTILRGLQAKGYNVVDSSLARNAQAKFGWDSPERATDSVANLLKFQEEILLQMQIRDDSTESYLIVDRTPFELIAYSKVWIGRMGAADKPEVAWWLEDYTERCLFHARKYQLTLFVPIDNRIPFVEEPGRAKGNSRIKTEEIIQQYLWEAGGWSRFDWRLYVVQYDTPENQLAEVASQISDLLIEDK